jgi:hypothetical protein
MLPSPLWGQGGIRGVTTAHAIGRLWLAAGSALPDEEGERHQENHQTAGQYRYASQVGAYISVVRDALPKTLRGDGRSAEAPSRWSAMRQRPRRRQGRCRGSRTARRLQRTLGSDARANGPKCRSLGALLGIGCRSTPSCLGHRGLQQKDPRTDLGPRSDRIISDARSPQPRGQFTHMLLCLNGNDKRS